MSLETILHWLNGIATGLAAAFNILVACYAIRYYRLRSGYDLTATCTVNVADPNAHRITNVTVLNRKDRPIIVFAVEAIVGAVSFRLENYDPPKIIQPLEAHRLTIEHTSYTVDGSPWAMNLAMMTLRIFLVVVTCWQT